MHSDDLKIAGGIYVISAGPPEKTELLGDKNGITACGSAHLVNNMELNYILQEPRCNIQILRRKKNK